MPFLTSGRNRRAEIKRFAVVSSLAAILALGNLRISAGDAPAPAPDPGGQNKIEKTSDLLNTARTAFDTFAAVDAIEKLAKASPQDEQQFNLTSELLALFDKKDQDAVIRQAVVETLGVIQKNTNHNAKTKYIRSFTEALKDKATPSFVRSAIAKNFASTLDINGLPDQQAIRVMTEIAQDRGELNPGLRGICIIAMGELAPPDALTVLTGLMNEVEFRDDVTKAMNALLSKITGGTQVPLPTVNKFVAMLDDRNLAADLTISVMKVLATMIRDNNLAAKAAMPKIIELLTKDTRDEVVIGAIQAMGIIGSAEAVEPLKKTHKDYFGNNAANPKDVAVRVEIMKALRMVISSQGRKTQGFDQKAVQDAIVLIMGALDEGKEVTAVKIEAAQAAIYLHSPKFKDMVKDVIASLYLSLKTQPTPEFKKAILRSLEAITNVNFGDKPDAWDQWFNKKFPKAPANK